jgi:hypothetical protein
MEFRPMCSFPFGGQRQLKAIVAHLVSLEENEISIISDTLARLDAPINSRAIRTAGEWLHDQITRLSDDEWENIVALLLQLVSIDDFMASLDDLAVIDDKQRAGVQRILDVVNSNEILKRTIAIDKLLERGPRLQYLRWFCDIRTQLLDFPGRRTGPGLDVPKEEVRLPIITIRMKIDEVEQPVYFQMSASELEDHIAMLQRARDELRCLEKGRDNKAPS